MANKSLPAAKPSGLRKAGVVDVVVVGDGFEKSSALNLGSTNFIQGAGWIPSSHLYAVQSTISRTIN